MEISKETMERIARVLEKINNHLDNEMCLLQDQGSALRGLMTEVDISRDDLAQLTKQAKAGPSSPPPGRP